MQITSVLLGRLWSNINTIEMILQSVKGSIIIAETILNIQGEKM